MNKTKLKTRIAIYFILFCILAVLACIIYNDIHERHSWYIMSEDDYTRVERCEKCGMERYYKLRD